MTPKDAAALLGKHTMLKVEPVGLLWHVKLYNRRTGRFIRSLTNFRTREQALRFASLAFKLSKRSLSVNPEEPPLPGRYRVQAILPDRLHWITVTSFDEGNLAIIDAFKRARIAPNITMRVWDSATGRVIWKGKGFEAELPLAWGKKPPPGLVGYEEFLNPRWKRTCAKVRRNPLTKYESTEVERLLSYAFNLASLGKMAAMKPVNYEQLESTARLYNNVILKLVELIGLKATQRLDMDWISGPGLWLKQVIKDREARAIMVNPARFRRIRQHGMRLFQLSEKDFTKVYHELQKRRFKVYPGHDPETLWTDAPPKIVERIRKKVWEKISSI